MTTHEFLRPYVAAFASRFQQMWQYRVAAYAGFATQCWWGGIKVMVLAAFTSASVVADSSSFTLAHAITYTWLAQGLLALLPWSGDPEVSQAVRSGAIAYDRLRPVDAYALWFARTAGWISARVLPRAALMVVFAAVLLPLAGFDTWAWQPPASATAGVGFMVSILLGLLLSASLVMLLNIAVAAAMNEKGVYTLAGPIVTVFSGNLLPLAWMPDAWQSALLVQPFAGLMDIPARIYFGQLQGAQLFQGLALQVAWIVLLVIFGRVAMGHTMRRLEIQGG